MSERGRAVGGRFSRAVLAVAVALVSQGVWAQDQAQPAGPEDATVAEPQPRWGTVDASIYEVNAWDFNMTEAGQTWSSTLPGYYRYRTSPILAGVIAGLNLPAGARVTRLAVEACDTSVAGLVSVKLARCLVNLSSCVFSFVETGDAPAPGCGIFSVDLTADNIVINHDANSYFLTVNTTTADDTTSFRSVRVYYKLQVNPAPATVTFPNDVPRTHPFFQYVEALARSGVTGGCGPGAYCPDSPVTRGQMAVFLSVALGLHWPN